MQTSNKNKIEHQNLVQIAGLHSYFYYAVDDHFEIEGQSYTIWDSNFDHPSGLDASLMQNIETGEFILAYVGTDAHGKYGLQDIITDAELLGDVTPEQLEEANRYYQEMEKYVQSIDPNAKIDYVTGNSLGGALANSVAIRNPEVMSVTYNPALLPGDLISIFGSPDNIINYIGLLDALDKGQSGIQFEYRVPGEKRFIDNGVQALEFLGINHTGYNRVMENGVEVHKEYVVIGEKGQPGFGKIYTDAHNHIVTSLFTGAPLYGDSGEIELNEANMNYLAQSITPRVLDRIGLVNEYMSNAIEIVRHEESVFSTRVLDLEEEYLAALAAITANKLLNGIESMDKTRLESFVRDIRDLLETYRSKLVYLNLILNSPPSQVAEHFLDIDISAQRYIEDVERKIDDLDEAVRILKTYFNQDLNVAIREMFMGEQRLFDDAVVKELHGHYDVLHHNKGALMSQAQEYQTQIAETTAAMFEADEAVGSAIAFNTGIPEVRAAGKLNQHTLTDSPYALDSLRHKERHLEASYVTFVEEVEKPTADLLNGIVIAATGLIAVVEATLSVVKGIAESLSTTKIPAIVLAANPVTGFFVREVNDRINSYFRDVHEAVSDFETTTKEIKEIADVIKIGLREAADNVPGLIDGFKPYIREAFFNESDYLTVSLYNQASLAIVKEIQLSIKDVVEQLSQNKSAAVRELAANSRGFLRNLNVMEEQIARATIQ